MNRATVHQPASARAVGVRCGRDLTLTIAPAEIGAGLVIARPDLGASWPLDLAHACPGQGCSTSGAGECAVMFTEHLMAALWAREVTDATITLDGPEVPLFDGSALPLLALIDAAGVARSGEPLEPLVLTEPAMVIDGERVLIALPGEPEFAYWLAYDHPMIGREFAQFRPGRDDFDADLAPARTFITVEEADLARSRGMLAGGDEQNCVVVYPDHLSEEPALPQPFARHKLIDLIGDLYLLGRPIAGRVFGFLTGHRHNQELAGMLAKRRPGSGDREPATGSGNG